MKSPLEYPVVVTIETTLKIYSVFIGIDFVCPAFWYNISNVQEKRMINMKVNTCGSNLGIFRVKKIATNTLKGNAPTIIKMIATHRTEELS